MCQPARIPAEPVGPSTLFGKFRIDSLLGRGGCGDVWKAYDTELARWVALKFLRSDEPGELARFRREAQTAAQVTHPNIAVIHEVGEIQGRPFIAMQYIAGPTLGAVPRGDVRMLVALVRDAALAVHAAHERGIVHRDLKPANLMVSSDGSASGRIYVMDFGLAKAVTVDKSLTQSGMAVGTPSYMPPEQARGESQAVDVRSDVYSLGATLYDLLAGRPPFVGKDLYELLLAVMQEEPRPLRSLNGRIDRDLETIVMKCLEKEPARRYDSARALADDLSRWLDGEPIAARPISTVARAIRTVRRHKALSAAIGACVLAIAVGAVVVALQQAASSRELRATTELSALWADVIEKKRDLRSLRQPVGKAAANLRASVERVKEWAARHPGRAQGWYVLARGEMYLDELGQAEEHAKRAVQIEPGFGPGWTLLGIVRMEQAQQLLLGDVRLLAQSVARQRELIVAATDAFNRGDGDTSVSRWGLPQTTEDVIHSTLAKALAAYYVHNDQPAAIAALEAAMTEMHAEEYAIWRAGFSALTGEGAKWIEKALEWAPGHAFANYARGAARQMSGNPAGAAADLDRVIAIRPDFLDAYIARGKSRRDLRQWDAAIADFDRALAGGHTSAGFERGRTRFLSGDYRGAIEDYDRVLAADGDDLAATLDRGAARQNAGDIDGAIADFSRAIELAPRKAEGYTNRALLRQMQGRIDEAMADHDRAVEIEPGQALVLGNRASCRFHKSDMKGAIEDSDRAIRADPRYWGGYYTRGAARTALGMYEKGVEDLEVSIALRADNAESWYALATARRQLAGQLHAGGREADAVAALKRAVTEFGTFISMSPSDVKGYHFRGEAHTMLGAWDAAIADFDRVLAIAPSHWPSAYHRGLVRRSRGDPASAIPDFDLALSLNAGCAEAFFQRGMSRQDLGDVAGAIADLTSAIGLRKDYVLAYVNRGLARQQRGDADGAMSDFDRALALDPEHAACYTNRGGLKHAKGDFKGAISDYNRALERDPGMAEAWLNRGLSHSELNDLAAAIADIDHALALKPRFPYALYSRGLLKERRGDRAGARADCEKALSLLPDDSPYRVEVQKAMDRLKK